MQSRIVIWDFDGTLAWRDGMWSGALAEAALESGCGQDFSAADFRPFLQSGFPWHDHDSHYGNRSADEWWRALEEVFCRAYRAVGLGDAESRLSAQNVREVFLNPDRWRVYDDVQACMSELSQAGWRHTILSNHVPELHDLVNALSLHEYIDRVFTSAIIGYEKPHPQSFQAVLKEVDAGANLVMVGDSYTADVAGAESAGIPAILVRRHHASARRFAERLDDLPQALEELFRE